MHYLGGKHRLADKFAPLIQDAIDSPGTTRRFFEPFVGGFNVVPHLAFRRGYCNDLNRALVTLYQHLQNGWQPPRTFTKERYEAMKLAPDPEDPTTAFAAFGLSFSGMEWAAYTESTPEADYCRRAAESLLRKSRSMRGVTFTNYPFWELGEGIHDGDTVYCDPPYLGTKGYGNIVFDHEPFYEWCESIAAKGAKVFVSEFTAPQRPGWDTIWEVDRQVRVNNGSKAEGRAAKENIRTDRLMKVTA